VAALQSRSHHVHIAVALEGVIHSSISHVDDDLLDRIRMLRRIDNVRTPPLLAELQSIWVQINANDSSCLRNSESINNSQPDCAQSEDSSSRASFNLDL